MNELLVTASLPLPHAKIFKVYLMQFVTSAKEWLTEDPTSATRYGVASLKEATNGRPRAEREGKSNRD
jgi:hypothetical protein